jgi:hypothetical protein
VKQVLNIQKEAFSEKYLGLPTAVGRITDEVFEYITDSARGQMNGWDERFLSYPDKEVLIKLVAQAKSTYSMSAFDLSQGSCKKLVSMMARFWWSGILDKRSMHWTAWENLAVPKVKEGMGFRDMHAFIISLLGKQGWRLLTSPKSLCVQVLKGRYYPDRGFMEATAPRATSRTWRAILTGRRALELGLIKRVGVGDTISVWTDSSIPSTSILRPMGRLINTDVETLNELFRPDLSWDEEKIQSIFFAPDADAILQIPLRRRMGDDTIAWAKDKSGCIQFVRPIELLSLIVINKELKA